MIAAVFGCLAASALLIVMTPRPVTPVGVTVNYRGDLAKFRLVAPYAVLAPAKLPVGWRPDKDQRSMYRSALGSFTIVVTGTVGWRELSVLADSLRPQP